MILYTTHITPRLKFIAKFFLGELLGIEYRLSEKLEDIENSAIPVINYSSNSELAGFHISPEGLLFEEGIRLREIQVENENDFPIFFKTGGKNLSFDIFSASFYLLSRYEEYLETTLDKYGRYKAENSLAFKNGFLKLPVVNIWANHLRALLLNKFPDLNTTDKKSECLLTVDIDNPWAHLNKSTFRLFAGIANSLFTGRFGAIRERFSVLSGREGDPYETYSFIEKHHDKDLIVFILAGDKGRLDNKVKITNQNWRNLIKNLSQKYQIGLHPSFLSNNSFVDLTNEKRMLDGIIGRNSELSRQHFLILKFPKSYENLIRIGVKRDFSMGYADYPGFRAGTSSSFNFYNLINEEESDLRITPFCVMDRTLKDYRNLNIEEAPVIISELIEQVLNHGGAFVPVWHNESFSGKGEWKDWDNLYLDMLNEIKLKFTV